MANAARRIARARDELLRFHQDPRGSYHWTSLPLLSWDDRSNSPGLATEMKRIAADAAAGCDQSIKFLQIWQEVFELCDRLRYIRPPKIEPSQLPVPVAINEEELDDWLDEVDEFQD